MEAFDKWIMSRNRDTKPTTIEEYEKKTPNMKEYGKYMRVVHKDSIEKWKKNL